MPTQRLLALALDDFLPVVFLPWIPFPSDQQQQPVDSELPLHKIFYQLR